MNLLDITHLLNHQNKLKQLRLHLHAFHSFNQIILFIQEPHIQFPFMLTCSNANLFNFNLTLRTYKFKPPVEFMDELFYFNKIKYYVKTAKSVALSRLFSKYNLRPELSSNRNKYDYVMALIKVHKSKQKYSKLLKYIYRFQHVYSIMLAHPKRYFSIISDKELGAHQVQKIKSKIKATELNRENILEKEAHRYDNKKARK